MGIDNQGHFPCGATAPLCRLVPAPRHTGQDTARYPHRFPWKYIQFRNYYKLMFENSARKFSRAVGSPTDSPRFKTGYRNKHRKFNELRTVNREKPFGVVEQAALYTSPELAGHSFTAKLRCQAAILFKFAPLQPYPIVVQSLAHFSAQE